MEEKIFLGEKISFWYELKKRHEAKCDIELLREITDLRGTISFYEDRLDQIEKFRKVRTS